jgi:hypothetical protein
MTMPQLFKRLTLAEETEMRQWARENYKRLDPIDGVWHPVVQAECVKMNELFYVNPPLPAGCLPFD